MEQLRSKYLVKDRVNNRIFETPQMAMMLIAMTLFSGYKKDRLKWVKDLYDALSEFDISLPTPIMAGVRTPDRQYSSCVLIETGDSMDSINATTSAITKYVSQKAGIGIGAGRIRALMSPVRNGSTYHTGVIPFYKLFAAGVKSCNQGGVRGGSATLHVPIWHLEIEDILVLKNNRGTEETRCRQLDYSVQFNRLFYERLISDGDITLFSPNDVGDMYDYFYTDVDKFTEMYEKFERSTKIRKKVIKASELFSKFMQERKDTGRIYFMNVDHCNTHSSFTSEIAITMSNLCQEITLPTGPLDNILDENGEISQCILAAQNWGKIKSTADFERGATLIVRALNALIDYQSYPVIAGELSTKARRPLGVGIINFAYWLAKNGTNYTDANLELIHEYAEAWSYYLIKASVDLAEEYGHCDKSVDTKYHHGIFPIHTYKKDVDELVKPTYKMDWDTLIERAKVHGIMNSTLMALMPSETSSQVSNSTNGIDPIRELVAIKQSKDGVLPQVAPELTKLKNKYEKMWDMKNPLGYIKVMAVLQKFIDQSISTNTTYNPVYFEDEKIPMSTMLTDMLIMYKYGIKTGYYLNTNDNSGEIKVNDDLPSDELEDEDSCDSCKI
jgi:ribonucleoside-diphosphate reductase alpha chain